MRSNGNHPPRAAATPRSGGAAPGGEGEVSEPLPFLASIAPLQSAMTVASDGGSRIKLDVPETEMDKIRSITKLRGKVLKVSIQVVKERRQQAQEWGDNEEDENEF